MNKKQTVEQKRKTPRHRSSQNKQKHHHIGRLHNDPYCHKLGGYNRNKWCEEALGEVDLFSGYEE
ncbi:MAG: hypothetical protein WC650_01825 [Candidatus Doudnabacteria bacterium]